MNIRKLHILSGNLQQTTHFYKDVLQLPVVLQQSDCISFSCGQTTLCFHAVENENPVYHIAFTLPSNQLEEAYRWMQQRVEILPVAPNETIADFSNWQARSFYFLDSTGNILEFIARYELHNETTAAFEGKAIVSVSEIGIVTEDVNSKCKEISEKFGVPFFAKQPPAKEFAVMGTDEGLFIVVAVHRPWFPTAIPSSRHWLKVVFSTENHTLHTYEE